MIRARLAIEIYHYLQNILPKRLRLFLKRYIDKDGVHWSEINDCNRILDGTPYHLSLNMRHWHQRWTYIKGHYPEPHITKIIAKHLKSGSVFIDIGANIGIHTLYAAYLVGQTGQCIAFEPNPHSFLHLQSHIKTNQLSNVICYQVALGDTKGQVRLENCSDDSVGSTLRPVQEQSDSDCDVPVERADSLLDGVPASAHGLCKIDVEGYELHVLHGMSEFIQDHPDFVYVVEITDKWLKTMGGSAQLLFDFFAKHGFEAYEILLPDAKLQRLEKASSEEQYDVLFAHNL